MRIGVDAKWYFDDLPSGRMWTRSVASRLKAAGPAHHWVDFFRSGDRRHAAELPPCDEAVFASTRWNLLTNALVLPRHVKRLGLDVLLTQYFAAPVRIPQVTVVHDVIFETQPQFFTAIERAYLSGIKPLLRWATTVVAVSEVTRQDLIRLNYLRPGQRCVVIPNGVGARFLEPVPAADIARVRAHYTLPPRFVLYVGRLNARKNVDKLIEAMAQTSDRSVGLVLAGRAEGATENYQALAERAGLSGRAHFLGAVPDEDLAPLYGAASAAAYLSEHEGFGLPPLEAMAVGAPVIAAGSPAVREVCGDVPAYVNPAEVPAIARAIDDVLAGGAGLADRVAEGRRRAALLTWDRTAAAIADLLAAEGARGAG